MLARLPTGCPSLDELLGGGVEAGALTLVYGEPGSGKTSLALQLSREVLASGGKSVLFIDTEGLSAERLEQVCGARRCQRLVPPPRSLLRCRSRRCR